MWLGLLLAGTLSVPAWAVPVHPAGYESPVERSRLFARELGQMMDRGGCVPAAQLAEQLHAANAWTNLAPPRRIATRRPQDQYEQLCESVALVGRLYRCTNCIHWHVFVATAFVVHPDGLLLTNYHVLDAGQEGPKISAIGVMLRDGRVLPVRRVLAASKERDLALLQVDARDLPPLKLVREVRVGEPIFVLSHPVDHYYTLTSGIVSGKFTDLEAGAEQPMLTITADFAKGSSGGPVLNRAGEVVGIVHSTSTVYYQPRETCPDPQMVWKYCIPASAVLDLIQR